MNSGLVVINAVYNDGHNKSVLLVSSLFNPSTVLLYVAAIFVAIHMKTTDDQGEGKFILSLSVNSCLLVSAALTHSFDCPLH